MHTTKTKGNPCHGDSIDKTDPTWRPWVWVRIRQYSGIAIGFKVNNESPHDGGFICFQPAGKSCNHILPPGPKMVVISQTGLLKYWHYVNPANGGREATTPGAFRLMPTVVPKKGTAMIKVKRL